MGGPSRHSCDQTLNHNPQTLMQVQHAERTKAPKAGQPPSSAPKPVLIRSYYCCRLEVGDAAATQVLHAGRTKAPKAGEPRSAAMLAQWRTAKTFYATPFGSNDDWCGLPVPRIPCRR